MVSEQASKAIFCAYPLNSDATALQKVAVAVVSGLKSERKVAKEQGFTTSAFQQHVELYRSVHALPFVMLMCTANLTHEANACKKLYNVIGIVAIEVLLGVICHCTFPINFCHFVI